MPDVGYEDDGLTRGVVADRVEAPEPIEVTKLEIAAGAKIRQDVYPDPEKLSFWQKEAAGVLYINYVPSEEAWKIIQAGKTDMTANGEGFMKGMQVGHQAAK
jgi:hypothetical protein